MITVAFGFVAALSWKEAAQAFFTQIFGEAEDLFANFFYSVAATVVVVFVTVRLGRLSDRIKRKEEESGTS